jgi:hypothetical protein
VQRQTSFVCAVACLVTLMAQMFLDKLTLHIGIDVCVCSVCVFSVSTVSSETASRPNKRFHEDLSLDKPLHVIYKVSKLAYRI